jgi:glutamine synthetase
MGIPVEYSHHEVARSQHEIDLRHTDALTMADAVITFREVVKQVAASHGAYATFMPKPLEGENGNGMHVNMSLTQGESNAFYDAKGKHKLSVTAERFIAGLLRHAAEISCVCNQWVNSYKRLVPGFEAPVFISWSPVNRGDLIRVPAYRPGREASVRIEYRQPDPACNPYLAFAAMLTAGLEGVELEYNPLPQAEADISLMSEAERALHGIERLPGSLLEAVEAAQAGTLLEKALGTHTFESLLRNKRIEWERFRSTVTDYELRRYLPIL